MAVLCAKAQNISGRVVDENDAPIPYATVVAMQLPDSTFLGGVTTDNDGRFTLETACDLLKISFVGYEMRFVSQPKGNLGTLKMSVASSQLKEVTIAAKRPEITNLPDRTVVGVESTLLSSSADGIDMLKKTPGLLVDGQNNLSVIGQGSPIVYINNRRVYSMDEVYNLNPQNIKSIEIIHNPSSQYEADATAYWRHRNQGAKVERACLCRCHLLEKQVFGQPLLWFQRAQHAHHQQRGCDGLLDD